MPLIRFFSVHAAFICKIGHAPELRQHGGALICLLGIVPQGVALVKDLIQRKGKIAQIPSALPPFIRDDLKGIVKEQEVIRFIFLKAVALGQIIVRVFYGIDFAGGVYQLICGSIFPSRSKIGQIFIQSLE